MDRLVLVIDGAASEEPAAGGTADDGVRLVLGLEPAAAPRTRAALLAALPMPVDLHAARIAGRHLLWHAPFVVPLEAAAEVTELPPGTLLYWPERQFLELLYGPLQAERAAVTVLGRLLGPIEPLAELGARIRREQGRRPFRGRLELLDGPPPTVAPEPQPAEPLRSLRVARLALWAAPPAEIEALVTRRGVCLPAGPLLMAEAEARKLQEALWALLPEAEADPAFAARAALPLVGQAERRLADLYGLPASADLLALGRRTLTEAPGSAAAVLRELVLVAGRLAGWLDERIPWEGINAAVVEAAEAWGERSRTERC